jgi:hypothetical protein
VTTPQVKQQRSIAFWLPTTAAQETEHKLITAERRELDAREQAIKAEVSARPEVHMAAKLSGYSTAPEISFNSNGTQFLCTFRVLELVDAPQPSARQFLHLDHSTVNQLLNSALLTAAEKRQMLSRLSAGMAQLFEEPNA